MSGQSGFFDVDDRLKWLSDLGDQLEALRLAVDFEIFRSDLAQALDYSNGPRGGRPPFDPVMMFKILVIQAANNLSDERAEFLINDRLSFMRFLGLGLSDRVPDARTIWLFREKLTKAKERPDGEKPPVDIAIPTFGYKNHVSIDRRFGLIRTYLVSSAAAHDGARLREGLLDATNTAGAVFADTAYRSAENEKYLRENGFVSRIHRKKPQGKPMPARTRSANALKSKVRAHVEHVFAQVKDKAGLFVRTIGIERAKTKIGMANIFYNIKRLGFLERKALA